MSDKLFSFSVDDQFFENAYACNQPKINHNFSIKCYHNTNIECDFQVSTVDEKIIKGKTFYFNLLIFYIV